MRKLVLFSDGTGNSSAKAEKTNVWRMFQALDQSAGDQIARYDDGVGTSRIKFLAAIGGAFGWGLKRNVLDLYKFVCRHYQPGDRIYGFGFSRGAFTIRVLASMIGSQGLVGYRSEDELNRRAAILYRVYRSQCFPARLGSPVWLFRIVRDAAIRLFQRIADSTPYEQLPRQQDIPIEFLGLWDTVSAYGMPVEEFKPAINWLVWPMLFDDLVLPVAVKHACHALSLDDERTTFHPLVWDETAERRLAAAGKVEPGRMKQVWFAGVHSNVGGGYPEDQLALITLDWMMQNAEARGLRLIKTFVDIARAARSPYARLYDPRSGFGSFYRYSPRVIKQFKDVNDNTLLPLVHGSVIMRLALATDRYAPITLPTDFLVLAPDGQILPMTGPGNGAELLRVAPTDPDTLALQQAMASLANPNSSAIELALDTVWWRRGCYFATVAVALALLAFPLYGNDAVDRASRSMSGIIEPTVTAISAMVPAQAESWIAALRGSPIQFGALLVLLAGLYKFGGVLQARIRDRSMFGWHAALQNDYLRWLVDHERKARAAALALGIAGAVALLVACTQGSERLREICVIAALLVTWAVWRTSHAARQLRYLRTIPDTRLKTLPSTLPLKLARAIRTNRMLVKLYRLYSKKFVPLIFGVAMVSSALLLANRAVFDIANSTGKLCKPTPGLKQDKEHLPAGADIVFDTSSPCFATGLVLERDVSYQITLTIAEDWFDRTIHTDVEGFPAFEALHLSATPLKRWWTANWFAPIARVGQYGNEEYILEPNATYHQRAYKTIPEIAGSSRDPITDDQARSLQYQDPTPPERNTLVAHVTAKSSGELFLFVNDAVLMPPLSGNYFYTNNRGKATIKVEPVPASPVK
jgi:uncharacterized protein (DUF2235 family)